MWSLDASANECRVLESLWYFADVIQQISERHRHDKMESNRSRNPQISRISRAPEKFIHEAKVIMLNISSDIMNTISVIFHQQLTVLTNLNKVTDLAQLPLKLGHGWVISSRCIMRIWLLVRELNSVIV